MLDLLDVGFRDMSKHRFVVYIRQSCVDSHVHMHGI